MPARPTRARPSGLFVRWGSLILLAAFWLRVRGQPGADFWSDEAVSILHIRATGLPALFNSLARNEGMPPLYFLGLRLWRGFGETEFVLRVLSIWLGVVGVALMSRLGRSVLGRRAGLLGAAIVAASSLHISLSQWMRPYALTFCLAIALLLVAWRLGARPTRRTWILFGAVATAGLYTLYILGALWLGVGFYVGCRRRHLGLARGLGPVAGVALGVLAAFSPWAPVVWHQSTWAPKALWWVPPPQPRLALETLDQFLLGAEARSWPLPVVLVYIPTVVAVLLWGAHRAWKAGRLSFTLLTTGMPLALIWLVSYYSPIYLPRHVVFALPGVVLLLVEGILAFKPPLRSALIVGLLGAAMAAQAMPLTDQGNAIPWSRVAAWLAPRAGPGDLVIFSPPFQQPAFQIKYSGPPLELRGIGEYEAYVHQPDAVLGVSIPLRVVREWVDARPSFWLLEDARWGTTWGDWEYRGSLEAEFPGLRVYRYEKHPTTNGGEP